METATTIKASELREGNLLQTRNGNIGAVVIGLGHFEIATKREGFINIWDCEPIPLTPVILEKCGFEKYVEKIGPPINDEIEIWNNYIIDVFFDVHGALVLSDYHVNINRPKYLHQLQNLYFALTGEELQIEL